MGDMGFEVHEGTFIMDATAGWISSGDYRVTDRAQKTLIANISSSSPQKSSRYRRPIARRQDNTYALSVGNVFHRF